MRIVVWLSIISIILSCGHHKNDKEISNTETTSARTLDTAVDQTNPDPTFSNSDTAKIIGTPIKLETFEVAAHDFPDLLTWELANKACVSLGNGWRLPTKAELNEIYKAKNLMGSFTTDLYWTSDETDEMNAATQNMLNGKQGRFSKIYMCKIRAVRSL